MLSAARSQECPAEAKSLPYYPPAIQGGAHETNASGDSAPLRAPSRPENGKPMAQDPPAVGFARLYSLLWIIVHTASPGFPLGFGYSVVSAITGCLSRLRAAIPPLAAAWWRRA